ncbi:hypothetical protein SKAU_G00399390 [Synaphobranchus kaupii]|uniref:Uncharacterized protein n=1 Tax=Synaphobranchus kaupii TaxID=118154 RepID=A0A9Q1E8R4_SYNKA|nr:hypothetical protein SKAU_G00399390 [Synaphobranchus kaupii]
MSAGPTGSPDIWSSALLFSRLLTWVSTGSPARCPLSSIMEHSSHAGRDNNNGPVLQGRSPHQPPLPSETDVGLLAAGRRGRSLFQKSQRPDAATWKALESAVSRSERLANST